ncbi:vWA domain-containing protein, partial [Clostridium sp.]|uniref:vWA domain-containing protein n=1 Tax=Clostridium sp. TaxID=1506 RepID=UPI003F2DA6C6
MKRTYRLIKRKKTFNRIYSSILAIAITASILNYNKIFTLANDPSSSDQKQVVSQAESMQTSKDGMVDFIKSIKQTSDDNFDITLEVVTKDKVKSPAGASVVLTIDISSSMNKIGSNGKTLLENAKEAAKEFTNILLDDPDSLNEICIVVFGTTARKELDFTSNKNVVLNSINSIKSGSQTHMQEGLAFSRQLLEGNYVDQNGPAKKPRELNDKYIVLLSDGEPNYSYKGQRAVYLDEDENIVGSPGEVNPGVTLVYDYKLEGFQYGVPGNDVGDGGTFSLKSILKDDTYNVDYGYYDENKVFIKTGTRTVYDNGIGTISEGFIIKKKGIDIHSIFLTSAVEDDNTKYEQAKFTISNIASKGEYSEVNDVGELTKKFQEVSKEILEKTNIWKLTDPMGDYVEFNGFPNGDIPPGASFKDGVLTWSMLGSGVVAEEFTGPDNLPRYRYK